MGTNLVKKAVLHLFMLLCTEKRQWIPNNFANILFDNLVLSFTSSNPRVVLFVLILDVSIRFL